VFDIIICEFHKKVKIGLFRQSRYVSGNLGPIQSVVISFSNKGNTGFAHVLCEDYWPFHVKGDPFFVVSIEACGEIRRMVKNDKHKSV